MWNFVESVAVAVVAAFSAAFLATWRTKGETRWHASYDAYARILSSIDDIRFWAEETYASNLLLPSVSGAQLKAAQQRYDEARRTLSSFAHVGALVISDGSRQELEALLSALSREGFRFHEEGTDEHNFAQVFAGHCDKVRAIIDRHLPQIVESAKKDLK